MSRPRPSSRRAVPHRMPQQTHWRDVEPDRVAPGSEPEGPVEATTADQPLEVAPDVTAPEWVDWVQQSLRRPPDQVPPRSPAWPDPDPLADAAATPAPAVAAPPPGTAGDRDARRPLLVAGLAAALVLVLALTAGLWARHELAPGHPPTQRPVAQPRTAPAGAAHVQTRVRVRPDGRLWVRQWIRATRPMTSLALVAPVDPYLELGTVTATRLRVEAGGVAVPGPRQVTLESAAFALDKTDSVHLSYLLSGALERSPGSTRALARVTSLDLFARPEPIPTSYAFRGARILSLACTLPATAEPPAPCGSQHGRDWTVRFPQASAKRFRVMVQLDLSPHLADRR